MSYKSMKRPKKTKDERKKESVIGYEEPDYPYGLEINLENDSLKSLGRTAKDFDIGGSMEIKAKVRVDRTSSNKRRNGENYDSVGLQITDLDVGDEDGKGSLFDSFKKQEDSGHGVL